MNSFQQNKKSKKTLFFLTVIILLIATGDIFSGGLIRVSLRDSVSLVNGGVYNMVSAVSSAKIFSSKQALAKENAKLTDELRRFSSYRIQNEILKAENEALRSLVNLQEGNVVGKTARVVSSLKSSPFSTLIIDAGERDGISENDYAVMEGGVVVGFVAEVGEYSSLINLLTAPAQKSEVLINGELVEMTGRGGGNALVQLPREIIVSENDLVLLRGSGFSAGVIGNIKSTPASASQDVYISVPFNIQAQEFVTVFENLL